MASGTYGEILRRPGLQSFLWAQFLGAFNDNLFKIVLSLLVIHESGTKAAGRGLSLIGAVFVLPFLLLSGYAGQLADIRSKRTVLIAIKCLEIGTAVLASVALAAQRLELAYLALLLFALQATFFSPAKYGILPEFLPADALSHANGLLEMSTFVAIVAGTAVGSVLFALPQPHYWPIGFTVVIVAIVGCRASLGIPSVPAAAPRAALLANPWTGVGEGVRQLRSNRALTLAVFGISYFWFLGALLQLVVVLFGVQVLRLDDRWIGGLTACAAIGIGIGSLAAGRLSLSCGDRRLIAIGSTGMGLSTLALSVARSFGPAAIALGLIGLFSGLFVVPLNTLLQRRAEPSQIGRLMAANNFFNMVAILFASVVFWICSDYVQLTPDDILLAFGLITLVSLLAIFFVTAGDVASGHRWSELRLLVRSRL